MWRSTIPFLASAVVFLIAAVTNAEEHTRDSLQKVRENVASEKAVLIDVRDKQEWDKGHVVGAIFLPLSEFRLPDRTAEMLKDLPKDRILYTHCVVGMRALKAAEILKKHGYEVRALKPGYDELIKAGFEAEKTK
jgi:phage shock protein E